MTVIKDSDENVKGHYDMEGNDSEEVSSNGTRKLSMLKQFLIEWEQRILIKYKGRYERRKVSKEQNFTR